MSEKQRQVRLAAGVVARNRILEAGVKLADEKGFPAITARSLGVASGYTASNIIRHFKTMHECKQAIIKYAYLIGNQRVIAYDKFMRDRGYI